MQSSGHYSTDQIQDFYRFQVKPDEAYLKKMKTENKKVARIYNLNGSEDAANEIRGYTFPFTLFAVPEVQLFVFHNGLGEFTSSGYGLLDLAETQFQNRTKPFATTTPLNISSNFKPREKVG
jgi:CRISPR-associated endoribonuclease Cas6